MPNFKVNGLKIENLYRLKDKVVVVTGGSRGIGKMIATGFIQNSARVYICSRKADSCESTANELNLMGPGKCIPIAGDLGTEEGCLKLVEEVSQREKRVDVLVNNSGAVWVSKIEKYPGKAWDKLYNLNVKAAFFLSRSFLPLLDVASTSQDGARIINIGSVAGFSTLDQDTIAYDVSKAAIHHLTRFLAAELATRPNGGHITVNAIAPGYVPTTMTNGTENVDQSALNHVAQGVPLKRVGQIQDMAGLAMFLAGGGSSWMTGTIIPVDGGCLVRHQSLL